MAGECGEEETAAEDEAEEEVEDALEEAEEEDVLVEWPDVCDTAHVPSTTCLTSSRANSKTVHADWTDWENAVWSMLELVEDEGLGFCSG